MTDEVRVLYFAAARELCGTATETLALPEPALGGREFMQWLGKCHPALAPFVGRMRLAVNGELVGEDHVIRAGDEVAVLPPVAGGSESAAKTDTLCELRDQPLSVDEVLAAVRRPAAGAVTLFVGVVRDHAEGKSVARLDYEAHPELAAREMRVVLTEIERNRPEARLAALHRVGVLAVGDIAVVLAASAPHRAEAFAACRDAIERIKERVPIWKKEWAPDGSANWVNLVP